MYLLVKYLKISVLVSDNSGLGKSDQPSHLKPLKMTKKNKNYLLESMDVLKRYK